MHEAPRGDADGSALVDVAFRRLSPWEEAGYRLKRLEIVLITKEPRIGVRAFGLHLDPEFLVLAESQVLAETEEVFALPEGSEARELFDSLIEDGTLVPHGSRRYEFIHDYVFRSPSLAASIVLGRVVSEPGEWRDGNGTALADLLTAPVPA